MYCTITDIADDITEVTLIELSDDLNENSVNEDLVNAKIVEMSNYIDSYLAGSYSVPVQDNSITKGVCVSLVVCDLYQRRLGLDYSDSLVSRRSIAIKTLEKLRTGIMSLPISSVNEIVPSYYKVSSVSRKFTDEILDQF